MNKSIYHLKIAGEFKSNNPVVDGIIMPQTITGFLTALFNYDKLENNEEFLTENYFDQEFMYFINNAKIIGYKNRRSNERLKNGKQEAIYDNNKIYQDFELILFLDEHFVQRNRKILKIINKNKKSLKNFFSKLKIAGTSLFLLDKFEIIAPEINNNEMLIKYIYKNLKNSRLMFKIEYLKDLNNEEKFIEVLNILNSSDENKYKEIFGNCYTLPIVNGILFDKNKKINDKYYIGTNSYDFVNFKKVRKIANDDSLNKINFEEIYPLIKIEKIKNKDSCYYYYNFNKLF